MTKFLSNISLEAATDIQFKTTAGANAGKIEQDGNNLVLTNAVGDILLGDGASDVFIGDGTNNVDIIFEQSGSIKGDGSSVTLTLGGSNTTLSLASPTFTGTITDNSSTGLALLSGAQTFTGQKFFDASFEAHPLMLSGAQNFDNIDRSGFYNLYNTDTGSTNSPGFPYGTMIAIGNDKGGSGFGLQLAHQRTGGANQLRVRGMNDSGSAWSAWNTVYTSADTAAVANGVSTLATGDQIYDHVTTRISGLTGATDISGLLPLTGGTLTGDLEIGYQTNTSGTTGTTFLELDHNVGGDISQQQTFIDFKFTDTNANHTPQVRIGAQAGPDANADAISKEGAGSFVVYTSPIGSDESGGSTGLAESMRVSYNGNLTAAGSITAGGQITGTELEGTSLDINGNADIAGSLFVRKSSTHVAQGSFSANESHLDLYNSLEANTDQKGSIITFTDNYYDGTNYVKTTRAGIKGGTDTTGNTADGYLEFYTDSGGANTPNLALRLDKNQNATFAGTVTANGTTLTGATSLAGLATESYVNTAVSNLIDNAPANLNTLNELAEALNDDDDAIVTINTALAARLPLAGGNMTGAINILTDTSSEGSMLKIENDGTGDVVIDYVLTGANMWRVGIDNNAADAFKWGIGAFSSYERMSLSTAGTLAVVGGVAAASLDINGAADISGVTTIGTGTTGSPYQASNLLHIKGASRSIVQQSSTGDAYYMFGDAAANNAAWLGYDHSNGTLMLQAQTAVTINKNTTVSGSIIATTLDINGNADISGSLTMSGGDILMQDELLNFSSNGSDVLPQFRGKRSSTDLNSRQWDTEGGWAYTTFDSGTSNRPSDGINNANGLLSFNTHAGDGGTNNYLHQIAMTSNNKLWHRNRNGGSFGAWNQIAFTGASIVLDGNTITGINDSDEFTDDDAHIMTSAAINDRIQASIIANTDTQDLSISGQTLSLTNGGSVTLPDTDTQLSTEAVQDIVGAMLVGTETRIGVSYDDTNGRINFVVDDMTANTNTQLSNADVVEAIVESTSISSSNATTIRSNIGAGTGSSNLAIGTTSSTAKAGNTTTISSAQASAITANTSKTGITSSQASAITANTAKTGITSAQASAITANTAKSGITATQSDAITANSAKTGITSSQASAITANTAKTGITSSQASAITANTAKTGITSTQASNITANNAKTGITSGQTSAITANTSKVTFPGLGTTSSKALAGNGNAASATTAAACSGNSATATALTSGNKTITGNLALAGAARTLSNSTGDLTVDVAGDIILDAASNDVIIKDAGASRLTFNFTNSGHFYNVLSTADKIWGVKGTDGSSAITALEIDMANAGKATFNNDVVAFSDRKLKENIQTLDGKKVLEMRGVSFVRKDTKQQSSGVIAQEIQKVAPELVSESQGTLGVSYGNLVGYLIEAVKDQQKQIDELKELYNGCSK